jgi:tannase/feruloyl esterase
MRVMKTRILAGALTACAISLVPFSLVPMVHAFRPAVTPAALPAATPALAGVANPAECANLTTLKLPDAKVTEASAVPASATGTVKVPHCRVAGVIGKEIRFSLLMPDEWNHKFLMGGGGGFVGTVQNQAQSVVNAGYATVGTDTGHQGSVTQAAWALNNPERQENFGHLAVHRTAEVAKSIIRSYYGSNETRSYFSGCSNGGRQAMMEAQRYPADFDGIVAGAPAYDFTAIGAQFIKDIRAAFPDSSNLAAAPFSPETLKAIETQIVDKCDALDGLKDGLMEDPRACRVDVAALTGLTDAQRAMLKAIYAETKNKDGVIYPAQPVGGEGEAAGWQAWITGMSPMLMAAQKAPSSRYAFGTEMFKYLVFADPSFDYTRYDLSTYKKDTARAAAILNATDPNLDAFKNRGGKLLLWHGWSDPALTALGSIKYYDQVKARDPKAGDYFRMFLMPGVLHCAGGPGPDTVDWAAAIDAWVDTGKAPERIAAQKRVGIGAAATVARSRPLCPYPQRAVYSGSGSTDDAANFVCRQP